MKNDKTRGAMEKGCDAWTPIWNVARDTLPANTKIISLSAMVDHGAADPAVIRPRLLLPDSEPQHRSSGR